MSEKLFAEFGAALREFAQPEDLDPRKNKPIYDIRESGVARFNFRRGDFAANLDNRVSAAFVNFEDGIQGPLIQITQELGNQGVILEIESIEIGSTGQNLIRNIILVCRGNALELCGLK